jgi:hypothetical protein
MNILLWGGGGKYFDVSVWADLFYLQQVTNPIGQNDKKSQ